MPTCPTPHALDVMANLQKKYDAGYPEMQPGFLWWIGDIYAASYGPKRGQRLEPFKTLQSRGILWSGGSDYFVTPVAARYRTLGLHSCARPPKVPTACSPSGWPKAWISTPRSAATPPGVRARCF